MRKLYHNLKQTSTQASNIYWFICRKGLVKDHEVI